MGVLINDFCINFLPIREFSRRCQQYLATFDQVFPHFALRNGNATQQQKYVP
jgi:hypothetical protein